MQLLFVRLRFSRDSLVLVIGIMALVLASTAVYGCARPFLYSRTTHEGKDRYVKLGARYGYGQNGVAPRFAHPVTLSETEWAGILDEVYVKPRKSFLSTGSERAGPSLAFNENDRRYLARYLAEAFLKARPDELVVFYLSQPREPGVTEIASGGLFVEGRQIHLVIANYRQPVSMSFIEQRIWNDPLRPVGDTLYDIIPQSYQTLRTGRLWDLTQSLFGQVSELIIDHRASLAFPHETSATSGPVRLESRTDHEEGTKLEDQLRTLQRLREQGLITEEEYRLKRQSLLDQF